MINSMKPYIELHLQSCRPLCSLIIINIYGELVEILLLNCPSIIKIEQTLKLFGKQVYSHHQWCAFVPARHRLHHSYNQLALMPCCFSQHPDEICICSYIHCLRQVHQHPMHVRHHMLLERKGIEGAKDRWANDGSMLSTQQLIITVETNWTQLSVARASDRLCRS